jgi:SOS-response transcriptional repressor LexA
MSDASIRHKKKTLTDEERHECRRLKAIYQAKKKELKLTHESIGEQMGDVGQSAISHYLNGVNALNLQAAIIFSRALKVPISDFSTRLAALAAPVDYSSNNKTHSNVQEGPSSIRRLFLISSIQAGQMCESPDLYHPGDGEQQIETTAQVGPRAYALRVEGDSMTNPHGSPSIPDGSIVIVDPDIEAIPGRIVVAKIKGEDDATLKKLVKDGPRYYLKPLNPAYPMIEVDDRFIICGVAKKVELDLL